MSAKSEATSENTAFDVHGWDRGRSCAVEVKFSVYFMLVNCTQIVYSIALAIWTEIQLFSWPFCVSFEVSSVFIWYDIGFNV